MRCFIFVAFLLCCNAAASFAEDDELPAPLHQALMLYDDGQLLEAYSAFKDYSVHHPGEKEATFLLALSKWKMMWLSNYSAEDKSEVLDLLETTKTICEPLVDVDHDAQFYYAASIGVQAQIAATEGDWWQTAQLGKKMKERAQRILRQDPEYYKAAYLLGSFNYFADALPSYMKFLRSFLFLPGGSRKEGLKQLILAFQKGGILEGEAGRTLSIIYTYYEKRPEYGLQMCENVLTNHPGSFDVALYKGINFYFNKDWAESEEWLQNLRKQILAYSELHSNKDVVHVYMPLEREVRYWICRSLIQQNKFEEAQQMLNSLSTPAIHQPYWLMRAVLLSQAQIDYKQGNAQAAELKIDQVMQWKNVKDAHEKGDLLKDKEGKVGTFDIDFL